MIYHFLLKSFVNENVYERLCAIGAEKHPFIYSFNLCHSAICLRGELQTSFQWFFAEPVQRGPPNSSRPIT